MFSDHFEVFLADTEESKEIHYSIRYQVYCEEMGFEDKEKFPLQMEFDEDDDRSIHFIVRNKMTDQWVGTMRLINKQNGLLPIEQNSSIDEKINTNDLSGAVEMSRLCLIKDVRREGKDLDPPHGIIESDLTKKTDKLIEMPSQNKLNRLIMWGIFHAAAEYCNTNKMQYCYFMTTKILGKVLLRGGLNLKPIGEGSEHKGERFPFKLDAIATYHSDIWQGEFNNYQLYSELDRVQYSSVA